MKKSLILGVLLFTLAGRVLGQAPAQTPKRIRVGGQVMGTMLVHQVRPDYPREAKKAGIQGTVRLDVLIGQDGSVLDMKLRSGDQALTKAAMKAVSKWRYKPYLLNGTPVEVMTEIDINFRLGVN
jgi:protein TonB